MHEELLVLKEKIPVYLDCKDMVNEMIEKDWNDWRQTECWAFYYEHKIREILNLPKGRNYHDRKPFDYLYLGANMDCKGHCLYNASGKSNKELILNDLEDSLSAIKEHGYLRIICVEGEGDFDYNGEFKEYHNQLKLKYPSAHKNKIPERPRRKPRKMKKGFTIKRICVYKITQEDLSRSKTFQSGLKNWNGNIRRAKLSFMVENLPEPEFIIDYDI